ncbi:hypothetical protein GALMADRAFT_132764 [Galerina marginata CBS 339.88]|uniref:Cyanovirin-N domain-containing protein n=1 Tax=Galerina marginata (strain CBS 339.88) TaxID=685588 RepID=A0A067TV00_GALM3|nr:hypothetical protein GALMADRAFT_132764 [Galerina marginata CBS 339.88]
MFKNAISFIVSALTVFGVTVASAMPLVNPDASESLPVGLCRGVMDSASTCLQLPVTSDRCINFNGALMPFSGTLTGVFIPSNYICTFSGNIGCNSGEQLILLGHSNVYQDLAAHEFANVANSFVCSGV